MTSYTSRIHSRFNSELGMFPKEGPNGIAHLNKSLETWLSPFFEMNFVPCMSMAETLFGDVLGAEEKSMIVKAMDSIYKKFSEDDASVARNVVRKMQKTLPK